MTDPRLSMTPKQVADLDAWIAEQLQHFGPNSGYEAIRLMRAYERADRQAQRERGDVA